jgi:hypothetical protein
MKVKKEMGIKILSFILLAPFTLVLHGAEKKNLKKIAVTPSRITRTIPSYESFVNIIQVLKVMAGKARLKNESGTKFTFEPTRDARFGQTQQGIRLKIEKGYPLKLETEFGIINLETNSHIRLTDVIRKIESTDTQIVFDEGSVGTGEDACHNLKAIGAEILPKAQVAVQYLDGWSLNRLWRDYEQRYSVKHSPQVPSNSVSSQVKQSKKVAACSIEKKENKKDDEWELL